MIGTFLSSEIEANWHLIEPFLIRVRQKWNPGWEVADVKSALLKKEAQCWFVADGEKVSGVWITRLGRCGDTPTGLVWIACGEPLATGLELFEHTEQWFREKGCKFVEIVGRRGWSKVLPGYTERGVVLVKELS